VYDTLLLNVVQSFDVSNPLFDPDADGRLNVIVDPEPVIVKSVPVVDDASVIAGPELVCPVGPIDVIADVKYVASNEQVTPLHVKSPKSSDAISVGAIDTPSVVVSALPESARPVPTSSLIESPPMFKLVVDAVMNDAYVVDE
jgi:hypothetical protein